MSIPWERPDSGSLVCSDAACTTAAIFPTEAKAGEEYTVYWNFGLDGFRLYNLSKVNSMTYGDDWGSPLYPKYITIGPSGSQNPFSNPVYSYCCATYQKLVNDVWTPVDENLYYTYTENGGNRTNKKSLRLYGVADSGTYRMSDFYMSITDQNSAEILRLYPALPTAEVSATINPKQLTITGVQAVDRSYDGTNTVQLTGGTLQGLMNNDDVSFTLGEGTMINADQGTGKSVSTNIQLTGEKSGNYTLTQPTDLTVNISAGTQAAPTGITAADETISGKNDGCITNVTAEMEYKKQNDADYTSITADMLTDSKLVVAPGTYQVRYAAKTGYDASDSVTVTVNAGSKMTVTLPKDQTGYILTADKMTDLVWGDRVTLTFALTDGYSKTNSFEIAATNGATVSALNEAAGTYEIENITKDTVISVTGVADVTAPTGMIKVGNNEWKSLLNNITFDLFFKETKDVAITGADSGSGVKSVQYYVANKQLSAEEISALDTEGWKEYKTFSMNDEKSYVIYGKITDNAGNTTLICSNGMTVDKQAPVITGITDGETYYTTQKATVADDYLVEVNGVADSSTSKEIFLVGNTAKKYSVTAKDKAGNEVTYQITMKPIADLAKPIENITEDNVKSSDRDAVVAVKESAEGVSLTSATPEEKQAVQNILNLCNKLMNKQDETAKAQDPQSARDVQNITPMNVKSTDKNALETAQKDLETALDTYKNNLTEEEKTSIKNKLNTIEKSLNAIKNAENVQNLIGKLPEAGNIKTSDKAAIEAARKAYDALTDHEKELVQVEKLTKAEDALKKMGVSVAGTTNKTDKTNPKTGDESNPALWSILLILSCIGLNGTMLYCKRRKYNR